MKKWIEKPGFGGILLIVLLLVLAVVHIWMPFASNIWSWVVNFVPLALVIAAVLWFGRKPGVCADNVAILLAAAQGVLWGVTGAAVLGLMGCHFSPWYLRYPYDEAAFAIISFAGVLIIGVIFLLDLWKHEETNSGKRLFLQFCIVVSLALPVILPASKLMEYCEGILSQFVS